jgi:hypothetical protein
VDGPKEEQLHGSFAPAHDPADLTVLESRLELEQDSLALVGREAAHRGVKLIALLAPQPAPLGIVLG